MIAGEGKQQEMNNQRKSALAEYFHGNYNRLVSYVRGMIEESVHRSSEDVVQDVMLKISITCAPNLTAAMFTF